MFWGKRSFRGTAVSFRKNQGVGSARGSCSMIRGFFLFCPFSRPDNIVTKQDIRALKEKYDRWRQENSNLRANCARGDKGVEGAFNFQRSTFGNNFGRF
jgi:hypothetical protein